MHMQTRNSSFAYIAILLILVGLSVAVAYYRYIVREDFTYFQTEEQVPDHFDISSYSQL